MKAAFVLVALLGFAAPAAAQTVFTGGTVHVGDGVVIEKGVVVVGADGMIAAVGSDVAAPANATVIDATGKLITPGFIDVETQLGLVEVSAVDRTADSDAGAVDPGPSGDHVRAAFRAVDAFNPFSAVIEVQRAGGVTSVVTSPSGGLVAGQGAFVDLAAERGFATVVAPFAVMRVNLGAQRSGSRGTAVLRLREVLDDARYYEANRTRFDENRARNLAASRLDSAALAETMRLRKPVAFEVNRAADISVVLELSREYGLRPVIIGGAEAWKVAAELAAADAPVVLHPPYNLPFSFDMLGARQDNAALLARAGVPVVISSFDTHNVRNVRFHAGNAVRAGMDHTAALQAVTRNAANAMGVGATHGTLEPGKVANLVIWSGDPFQPETAVESVWIRGESVDLGSRQRELFERYRTLERRAEPASQNEDQNENSNGESDVEPNDQPR